MGIVLDLLIIFLKELHRASFKKINNKCETPPANAEEGKLCTF